MKLINFIKNAFKYSILLLELKLTEWHYNLLMYENAIRYLPQLVELRKKIDEIRTKMKEL